MKKFTQYWESYSRTHEDFMKEGQNFDDLLFKSKFNFHDNKLTFSSKSKFNLGSKISAAHEYGIKGKCCKDSTVEFKHKDAGETTLEGNVHLAKKDDFNFDAFVNLKNVEKSSGRDVSVDANLRTHYKEKCLFTLGTEKWNPLGGAPTSVALGTSYAHVAPEATLVLNTHFTFNVAQKFLSKVKLFLNGTKDKTTGRLDVTVDRTLTETTKDNVKEFTTGQNVNVVLSANHQYCPKLRIGGDLSYDVNTKATNFNIAKSYQFDRVRVNAKMGSDRSLNMGLTSKQDDMTLVFSARTQLNTETEKVGDKDVSRNWFSYNFGASAEFNRL